MDVLFLVDGEHVRRVLDNLLQQVSIILGDPADVLRHQRHDIEVACPQVGRQNVLVVHV